MWYELEILQGDVAQVQHDSAGFGSGRLVAQDLILTAAHTLWNETGAGPFVDEWQARLFRDYRPGRWRFRLGNRVAWYDKGLDLALIELVAPEGGQLRPELHLRVAAVSRNKPYQVEARGYPRASKQAGGPRELTPALGRLTAAQQDRPLRFGIDNCDLPNEPHADWPGMSGSVVMRPEALDPNDIWVFGVVRAVPANFNGQLSVARLADAWRNPQFRELLVAAGVPDEDAEDPSLVEIGASIQRLPDITTAAEDVIRSEEAIENTYRHVDDLELLKTVHDALHTIEFKVLRPMEEEGAATEVRNTFAGTFARQKRKIEERIERGDMPAVLYDDLMEQLETAASAFATPSKDAHSLVCGALNGLLVSISPRLDTAIAMTASELRLGHMADLMKSVKEKLPQAGSACDDARNRDFGRGVDDLADLSDELAQHVREHEQLQHLDLQLREICVEKPIAESLARAWKRIKRRRTHLRPPFSPAVEEEDTALKELEAEIDAAISHGDNQVAMKNLRAYFRKVSFVFQKVDSRFKDFTLGLSRLRIPLKKVLDSLHPLHKVALHG